MKFGTILLLILLFGINTASAQLSIPDIFTDNMILQRNEPIHFWGKSIPGNEVEVLFSMEKQRAVVKQDSTWSVYFKKQNANPVPQSVIISDGKNMLELKNVLVGDVWVCIGQSNMEWPMKKEMHFKDEVKNTGQPLMRLYNTSFAGKYVYGEAYTDSIAQRLNKNDFYLGNWQVCDSNTVKEMSAVGYYFAKEIIRSENIPIGLVNLAIGGSPLETFMSRDGMAKNIQFSAKAKGNWLTNDALPNWIRERGSQNVGTMPGASKDPSGPNHAYKPGFAFSAGVEPMLGMPIKGALWYQGESNSLDLDRVKEYGSLLKAMIEDYRTKWKQPKMPFYWVQLSSIDTVAYQSRYWPMFRDEQRKLLNGVENGGMAVTSDIGFKNDVHPTNKKDVGERLARWALKNTYGKKVVPSGPLPKEVIHKNGKVVIIFEYAVKGLKASDGKIIRGFSFDGKHEVPTKLKGNTVEIPSLKKPEFVYYAWKPYSDANLVNSEGLPASTFKIKVD